MRAFIWRLAQPLSGQMSCRKGTVWIAPSNHQSNNPPGDLRGDVERVPRTYERMLRPRRVEKPMAVLSRIVGIRKRATLAHAANVWNDRLHCSNRNHWRKAGLGRQCR